MISRKAKIDIRNIQGETCIDICLNFQTYLTYKKYLGKNINQYQSNYSRKILPSRKIVLHNNRADQIRDILHKVKIIQNKEIDYYKKKTLLSEYKASLIDFNVKYLII